VLHIVTPKDAMHALQGAGVRVIRRDSRMEAAGAEADLLVPRS
jgi:hypothetical protein